MSIQAISQLSMCQNFLLNLGENLSFAEEIQNNDELYSDLKSLQRALSLRLKYFEDEYLYDEIEYGNVLEILFEKPVEITVEDAVILIRSVAKHIYHQKEVCEVHKLCKGHFNEMIRDRIRPKNVEKILKATLLEWEQKKEIKSISIRKEVKPALIRVGTINKHYDLFADYYHKDNSLECSYQENKTYQLRNVNFESVIDRFERQIVTNNLDWETEFGKLARQVFGPHLILIKQG